MKERLGRRRHVSTFCRLFAAFALVAGTESVAHAGGFFIPDLGAQGLARGGAFTAKADDASALVYNIAGLARQRGTRLYLNANIPFNSYVFTRKGVYPDKPEDMDTSAWAGKSFATVRNTGGASVLPMLAVTTDAGTFDRLTLAAGIFPPSAIGNRTFPLGVERAPAASRYDYVQSKGLLVYPTIAGAVRITPWLDAGVAVHMLYGSFDQTTISYADLMAGFCVTVEDFRCDARSNVVASGVTVTGSAGVMVRPSSSLAFGAHFLGPSTLGATGTATAKPPAKTMGLMIKPGTVELEFSLPWVLRVGGRYIQMDKSFEVWDLELDVNYEAWQGAQTPGPTAKIVGLGEYPPINATVPHYYKNTFSLRAGGAYNIEELDGIISLRGGAFYDSTASESAFTRLDFDTLAKVAGTLGFGYKRGGVGFSLGYGAIASVPRTVTDGRVKPVNGTKGGRSVDGNDQPLPSVNNGDYSGFTHLLTFGVEIVFDSFFTGGLRKPAYGDPEYEEVAGAPAPTGDKPVDKPEDKEPTPKKPDEPKKADPPKVDPPPVKVEPSKVPNPTTTPTCKWGEC